MKGLYSVLILLLITMMPPAYAAYQALTLVSGSQPSLELDINKDDLELNLAKNSTIRLRLKVNNLYTNGNESKSFQLITYTMDNSTRRFTSTEAITLDKDSTGKRVIEIDVGRFTASSKSIEIDLLDTDRNVINTYSASLTATNTDSQNTLVDDTLPSTCNGQTSFVDCIDVFLRRVVFESIPQKKVQTRVVKDTLLNTYKVKIPITSLKGIDSLQIDSRSTPPSDPELGEFYVDDSEAICVYVNSVWVRLAGPGVCN